MLETAKQYTNPTTDDEPNKNRRSKKEDYERDDFERILHQDNGRKGAFLSHAKMRVLPGGKSAQTNLISSATHTKKTVFAPTDLSIEHTDRQTGKIKRLNISQVRANISANKTRLCKAKISGTDKQLENVKMILEYWWEREKELIQAADNLEKSTVVR